MTGFTGFFHISEGGRFPEAKAVWSTAGVVINFIQLERREEPSKRLAYDHVTVLEETTSFVMLIRVVSTSSFCNVTIGGLRTSKSICSGVDGIRRFKPLCS